MPDNEERNQSENDEQKRLDETEEEKERRAEEEERKKDIEEAERRRNMIKSILKGIIKFLAEAVITVAAFVGSTVQAFLFGQKNAFAQDRNELNKYKRDLDDARKIREESARKDQEREANSKEQSKSEEERNSPQKEAPVKELTDDEINDVLEKSKRYLNENGMDFTLCHNNDESKCLVFTYNNDGQANHFTVPANIIPSDSGVVDITELAKTFYTAQTSGKELSNEDVLTEPMAAVYKAAAVAEQFVSCTDPQKNGTFAKGSIQTCHGKVDFELERQVLSVGGMNMINHHIIIDGQRINQNFSFSIHSLKHNMYIQQEAEKLAGLGLGHEKEITLTDTEKIKISYREGEDKFDATFVRDGKEEDMGTFKVAPMGDGKSHEKNLGHFFLKVQNLKLTGKKPPYRIEPKAVAMAAAAFACPQAPVQLNKAGEEMHVLSKLTYTGNDDKEHSCMKTQASSGETPHIRMGLTSEGQLAFIGNVVRVKGEHKGEPIRVDVSGKSIDEVVKNLSAATTVLLRSSGEIEPENAEMIEKVNVRNQLNTLNKGLEASEQQIMLTNFSQHVFDQSATSFEQNEEYENQNTSEMDYEDKDFSADNAVETDFSDMTKDMADNLPDELLKAAQEQSYDEYDPMTNPSYEDFDYDL